MPFPVDIQISENDGRIFTVAGTGQTVFAYDFPIYDASEIDVYVKGPSDIAYALQTLTTHYTVSGVGNEIGGNVTFVTAPATASSVVLARRGARERSLGTAPAV